MALQVALLVDGEAAIRRVVALLVFQALLDLLAAGPAGGGPGGTPNGSFTDDDPSVVRPQVLDGVKSGRYRSLREVLGNLKLPEGSRLIDVDLRYLSNGDFYLLTIKDMSGRFRTLKVDARTGKLAR
ncbi:hypothetical protein [Agrobacterium vitis]|uniref:PepSY domain-containing protein n=1 Tax=Agrobacterium vitis TaxID=373 RepID=A0ABD6HB68_AGRVI|nr:hypothetical protein [Agrobacterium vitis]MUP11272.1 hypothetical protein [Agrobacterium vitis]